MGLGIYLVEVMGKRSYFKKGVRQKDIHRFTQLIKKFKKNVFLRKFIRVDIKEGFKKNNLDSSDWSYLETEEIDGIDYDIFFKNEEEGKKIKIPSNDFPIGKKKYETIRIREVSYSSGYLAGVYSAWFNIYDILSDNFKKFWYRWLFLMNKKEVKKFIDTFCKNKEKIIESIYNKMNDNMFVYFCW